jgi:hypothetical protein
MVDTAVSVSYNKTTNNAKDMTMPNWCNNTILITGATDKIAAIWAATNTGESLTGENGLLQALAPMPAELFDTVADGSTGMDWYNWRVANWGTKWDLNSEGLHFVDNGDGTATIEGYADSAWAPPIEAFQSYSNANPDVEMELRYFEPGMCFLGIWDSAGGDAYWEDCGSPEVLNTTAEADAVLYDLLEHFNVWDWFETDEDDEENLEIDLDGGLSAVNE